MLVGDIYYIKSRLKEIDSKFDITFDYDKEKYVITHKGIFFMYVNHGELDDRVIKHIKEVVWQHENANIFDEIDRHNEMIEKSKEREFENFTEAFAKDIRKPLLDAIDYGR